MRSDIPRNVLNVYRYEHHGYRGWAVSVKRGGSPYVEYFADGRQGPQASFEGAVAYRDRLLKRVPAFNKLKRSYVHNTTGEIGVARCVERTRPGRVSSAMRRHGPKYRAEPTNAASRPPSTATAQPAVLPSRRAAEGSRRCSAGGPRDDARPPLLKVPARSFIS